MSEKTGGGGVLRRAASVPVPAIFGGSIMLAIALLAWQGTLGKVVAAAGSLHWPAVVAALIGYAIGLAMLAARWHALVSKADGSASPPVAAEVFLTSVIVNYAAPIGLAVPARAALSKRDLGLTAGGSGAVVMWEAALDLMTLALIGGLWLLVGGMDAARVLAAQGRGWAITFAILAVSVVVIGAVVVTLSEKIRGGMKRFAGDAMAYPRRQPGWAALAGLLTVGFWMLQ
ncbi:MAG: lysylphosphatidylglycerol synthase domain-containing protein, partial [Thermomicrobiales bacterium]